jgi:hypothetical protein
MYDGPSSCCVVLLDPQLSWTSSLSIAHPVSLEPDVLDGLHKTEKTALEKPIISMLCLDNTLLMWLKAVLTNNKITIEV